MSHAAAEGLQPLPGGWDYGPAGQSIVLYGSWCSALQAGAIQDLKISFGCPPVGIAKP